MNAAPLPFVLTQIRGFGSGEPVETGETLKVSVETLTETPWGMRILPTKVVCVAIGDRKFHLQAGLALDMAMSVIELHNIIESEKLA